MNLGSLGIGVMQRQMWSGHLRRTHTCLICLANHGQRQGVQVLAIRFTPNTRYAGLPRKIPESLKNRSAKFGKIVSLQPDCIIWI
jgi:hypothetical protein